MDSGRQQYGKRRVEAGAHIIAREAQTAPVTEACRRRERGWRQCPEPALSRAAASAGCRRAITDGQGGGREAQPTPPARRPPRDRDRRLRRAGARPREVVWRLGRERVRRRGAEPCRGLRPLPPAVVWRAGRGAGGGLEAELSRVGSSAAAATAPVGRGRARDAGAARFCGASESGCSYALASNTRLKGVSAARRKRLNPAAVTMFRIRSSPACAPSAAPTSCASDAGVQIMVEAE